MKKFKLLRDLPDINAGAIFEEKSLGFHKYYYDSDNKKKYSIDIVENNPDWFEEITIFKVGDIVVCEDYSINYNGMPLMITRIYEEGGYKYYNFTPCEAENHNFAEYNKIRLATNDEIIQYYKNQGWVKGVTFKDKISDKTYIIDKIRIESNKVYVYADNNEIALAIDICELVEEYPKTWEELEYKDSWYIDINSEIFNTGAWSKNNYATYKQAESALAFAQLSQLHKRIIEIYNKENNCDWKANWKNLYGYNFNWIVKLSYEKIKEGELFVTGYKYEFHQLSFPTKELAEFSLKYHRDLWEKYYEIE